MGQKITVPFYWNGDVVQVEGTERTATIQRVLDAGDTVLVSYVGQAHRQTLVKAERLTLVTYKPGTLTTVSALPSCDVCRHHKGEESVAVVDGKTARGSWANMCADCFRGWGIGLGIGRGQRLTTDESKPQRREDRRTALGAALEAGDMDAVEEIIGDEDPLSGFWTDTGSAESQ